MKSVLSILLLLVMVSSVMAQDNPAPKGIKGGINMAKWVGDGSPYPSEYEKTLTGFVFGAFFTLYSGPQISIQPEILYSMKGIKYSDGSNYVKFKTNYLEIPVLLKYNFPSASTTKVSIYGGPAVALLMSATAEESDGTLTESSDVKDMFKDMDLGLTFGLGLGFETGSGKLITVDGRFTMGMSNIPDDDEDIDIKNSTISVLLGYSL